MQSCLEKEQDRERGYGSIKFLLGTKSLPGSTSALIGLRNLLLLDFRVLSCTPKAIFPIFPSHRQKLDAGILECVVALNLIHGSLHALLSS